MRKLKSLSRGLIRNLEDSELLRSTLSFLFLRLLKMEPSCPLAIRNSNNSHLTTLWKMRLNLPKSRMILSAGRPILYIDRILDHAKTPVKQVLPEASSLSPLIFCFNRQIEHDQAPHWTINHFSHSHRLKLAPATLKREDDPHPLQRNARIAAPDLELLLVSHTRHYQISAMRQQLAVVSHHYLKVMQLARTVKQPHQPQDETAQSDHPREQKHFPFPDGIPPMLELNPRKELPE